MSANKRSKQEAKDEEQPLCLRHLRLGWWSLLIFLSLGIVLEGLHGFKFASYLGVDAETRRLMWTLAHTHGTLLSLVHLAYAFTIKALPVQLSGAIWASYCLTGAGVLMPFGFFLGGLFHYSGDPGLGILLVPPGALLLFICVLLTAWTISRSAPSKND